MSGPIAKSKPSPIRRRFRTRDHRGLPRPSAKAVEGRLVGPGAEVKAGQQLAVVEAMKM